ERASVSGERAVRFTQVRDGADDETTDHVHGQRAIREGLAVHRGLHHSADEISGDRSQKASHSDQEKSRHTARRLTRPNGPVKDQGLVSPIRRISCCKAKRSRSSIRKLVKSLIRVCRS